MAATEETIRFNIQQALESIGILRKSVQDLSGETSQLGKTTKKTMDESTAETKQYNQEVRKTEGYIERVERLLKEWEEAARKATNPTQLEQYNRNIIAGQKELKRLRAVGVEGFENINKQTQKTNKLFSGLKSTIAAAFSIYAIKRFLTEAVKLYDIQSKSEAKLLTALKGRTDIQQRLIVQANQLQETTLFGNEKTIAAQAQLAKILGDNEQAISRLIPLVQDFATIQNFDLERAAELVAKTIGSTTNSLTRYGIAVKGAANSSERLETTIKELTRQVGGQAEAAVTGAGKWQQFLNRLKDNNEYWGKFVTNIAFGTDKIKRLDVILENTLDTFNDEIDILKNSNLSNDARRVLIQKINKEYGAYLPKLLTEKSTLSEIETAQKAVNKAIGTRIVLIRFQEEINALYSKRADAIETLAKNEIFATKQTEFASAEARQAFEETTQAWVKANETILSTTEEDERAIKEKFERMAQYYDTTLEAIQKLIDGGNKGGGLEDEKTAYETLKQAIQDLNKKYLEQITLKKGSAIATADLLKEKERELQVIENLAKGYKDLTENIKAISEEEIQIDTALPWESGGTWEERRVDKEFENWWNTYVKTKIEDIIGDTGEEAGKTFEERFARSLGFKDIDSFREFKDAYKDLANELVDVINTSLEAEVNAAETRTELLNTRIQETELALANELKLYEQGFAANVTVKRKELETLKKEREKALQDQAQAVQKQRILEGIQQSISLTTSVAEIIKSSSGLGFLAIPAIIAGIAGIFALFKASKAEATALTKYASGGQIKGKPHSQGGVKIPEMGIELEGEEYIVNKQSTRKHLPLLEAINKGSLKLAIDRDALFKAIAPQLMQLNQSVRLDDSKELAETNKLLRKSIRNKITEVHDGYKIERFNNVTRKITLSN